jgi:hypothetical protein
LARIYEVFPLVCPTCQTPLTFIAFLTEPEPISLVLAHIGEPTSPPLLNPTRGPPQTDLAIGTGQAEQDEAAQDSFPDDSDQTTPFDPAEPEPIPQDHFDQSWGGLIPEARRSRRRRAKKTAGQHLPHPGFRSLHLP